MLIISRFWVRFSHAIFIERKGYSTLMIAGVGGSNQRKKYSIENKSMILRAVKVEPP